MITFKCPQCGTQLTLDENVTFSKKCHQCDYLATLEKDAPEELEKIRRKEAEFEAELNAVCQKYIETDDVKDVHSKVENFNTFAECTYLYDEWKTFILNVTGAAEEKKDVELQTYLKNHAKEFDSTVGQSGAGLFSALLQAYPKVGTNNDWDDLIKQTCGDNDKFARLCDNLINYIVKTRDKAFAMDIFNLLSAQEDEWAEAGRIYLRALLSSEEVAANVFPKASFNGRTKKFIKKLSGYCKKYLSGGNEITLEETKVWSNYLAARKAQKRRNVIIILVAAVIAAGTAGGVFAYLEAPNKETVKINIDRVIEVVYGEKPDLSEYSIVYDKNSGAHVQKNITEKMLKGYDPEKLGEQTGITINFGGVRETVTVIVKNAQLDAPVLKQSGNYVTWDIVPNTETYAVLVNRTVVASGMTTTTYDLSQLSQHGELSVTARAETSSDKYDNSAESEPLVVTKLKNPDGLNYKKGVLSWNPVEGATLYEVVVNSGSAVPVNAPATSYAIPLNQGENDIKITVKGAGTEVHGVSNTKLNYEKLAEISSLTYSGDVVKWVADSKASSFDIYVDGALWRTFNSNEFDVNNGFIDAYGDGLHSIGIVCKSLEVGVEESEHKTFNVFIGNKVSAANNELVWDSLGSGAAYYVECNGTKLQPTNANSISISALISGNHIKEGDNVVSISARHDNKDIVLETITLKKHAIPKITVTDNAWTGTADGMVYTFDNAPVAELPELSNLAAGVEHTVTAQRVKSSATAFEVDSEVQTITVYKSVKPTVYVEDGEVKSNISFDENKFELKLAVYRENGSLSRESILVGNSLEAIRDAGEYTMTAYLAAKAGATQDYDVVINSDISEAVTVTKLAAPDVIYTNGDTKVTTSATGNIKFFYINGNGEETELVDGQIDKLPAGMFDVYARAYPASTVPPVRNVLASEPTPASGRAHVFNMNIEFSISDPTQNSFNAVFNNCAEIDELSFSYEIKYFDIDKNQIGSWSQTTPVPATKKQPSDKFIVRSVNFMDHMIHEDWGMDVYYVQLIVNIQGASGGMTRESEIKRIPRKK